MTGISKFELKVWDLMLENGFDEDECAEIASTLSDMVKKRPIGQCVPEETIDTIKERL